MITENSKWSVIAPKQCLVKREDECFHVELQRVASEKIKRNAADEKSTRGLDTTAIDVF